MKRIILVLLVAITALALSSPAAFAKKTGKPTYVPPNQSAASQYTEAVPTAGGNTPSGGISGSGSGSGSSSISARTLHKLDHSGAAGASAAALAQSLAPATQTRSTSREPATGAPAAQVIKTLGGSDDGDGIGFLLPVILGLSLVGATVLGLMRIRRTA